MIARAASLAALGLVLLPASAGAHALLDRTEPERGATLQAPPEQLAFIFNEPVEASFGAIRVFDADGDQLESGEITRPGGESEALAVALPTDLQDGTYTATYRVISADSHPVSGGFVFSVGKPGAGPAESVSELLDDSDAGPATSVAYWTARWLGYAAIGLGVGLIAFGTFIWRPALRRAGGRSREWTEAADRFAGRARALLLVVALIGLVSSVAALVLQGATAAGTSFWSALDPDVVGEVLETRFGLLTGVRALSWMLILGIALAPRLSLKPRLLALPALALVVTPPLSGHATTQDPSWLLFPADLAHIVAMSLWLGGLAALALVVPAATKALAGEEKSVLLAAALVRFSPLALGCVIALVVGGVIQAIVYVGPLSDLVETGFGRAVLIKAGLLIGLICLGFVNRRRLLPELARLAERRHSPGRAGRLIRRTLRAEVATIIVVLGVTAALVSYAPPSEADAGPVSGSVELGAARLEYTVDPADVGPNVMHLYLFDADSGAQFTAARELRVDLSLPDEDIGPIEAELRRAGPGHYVAPATPFGVAGDWSAAAILRISRFDEVEASFQVPIE